MYKILQNILFSRLIYIWFIFIDKLWNAQVGDIYFKRKNINLENYMHLYIWEEGEISEFFSEINLYFTQFIFFKVVMIAKSFQVANNIIIFFFFSLAFLKSYTTWIFFSNKRYKKSWCSVIFHSWQKILLTCTKHIP